ncbi:MAG: hypothetical protein JXR55_07595, partial [Candidatus Fermentibacteraceae bacterium]|nr:hypothetical protein [Candidatus Fermentibacteraceae bacterium]
MPLILLLVAASALGGAGVAAPVLVPPYPWESEYSRELLLATPSISWRLVETYRSGLLSWRLFRGDYPLSTQRSAPLALLYSRSIEWSLQDTWLRMNRDNCLRTARDRTSLVPTIYLPLDMPPILAGAIGEGGQLDISGHQKITLSGISHYRPNAVQTEGESQSLFPDLKMEQELRVQLQGTIGDKIHVDVDHDSERSFGPQSSL